MAGEVGIGSNGDAFPLKQAPPNATLGQNTATDWRRILFHAIFGTGSILNGLRVTREGVLHSRGPAMNGNIPTPVDLQVTARSTPGQGVTIAQGWSVHYRGKAAGTTHEGAYLAGQLGAIDLPLAAADATLNRIDTVFELLTDRNIAADASATTPHGVSYGYVTGATTSGAINLNGTEGSAGAPPILPDGAVPLWDIPRNAGVNTITTAVLTAGRDRRKSAQVRGGIRALMPGDADADAGAGLGETTVTPTTASRPQIMRMWTGNKWRLVSPHSYTTTPVVPTFQNLPTTVALVTVPDPGVPYRVEVMIRTQIEFQTNDGFAETTVRVDGTSNTNPQIAIGNHYKPIQNAGAQYPVVSGAGMFPHTGVAPLTGSHTFALRVENPVGTTRLATGGPAADGSPGIHMLHVRVITE